MKIDNFIRKNHAGISVLYSMVRKTNNINYDQFVVELRDNLATQKQEDDQLLFYFANDFARSKIITKQSKPICPACQYLGMNTLLEPGPILTCKECESGYKKTTNKYRALFSMFKTHRKTGYRCPCCKRFLPHPLYEQKEVCCPYLDCSFAGSIAELKKMFHPTMSMTPP